MTTPENGPSSRAVRDAESIVRVAERENEWAKQALLGTQERVARTEAWVSDAHAALVAAKGSGMSGGEHV